MTTGSSYRQILRSSAVIGGASAINILVGLLRMKVAAVLLGPAGVGLIGLLQSLMATGSTVSALGFGTVGARQIAEANGSDDARAVDVARRALFWGTLGLAAIGASVFWMLRDLLATNIIGDEGFSRTVGWLAIGVALTVAAGSQSALSTGLRCIGDIARVSVLSALLSTTLGIGVLWLWQESGVLAFVLVVPISSFLVGHWFVYRLPKVRGSATRLRKLGQQWGILARLGASFMVAGLAMTVGQLVVRSMIQRELGADALGHFQAAWIISMTYISFVLGAMATDYYPHLTAKIRDHSAANQLVNEQTEVALLLSGPVLVAMLGLAPWVIELLYSSQFTEAAQVLRWQVLGDILKVASWPLGFIIMAAGDGRTFMLTESSAMVVFASLVWIGLPLAGVEAAGIAFIGMYLVYLPTVFLLARRRTGFAWQRRVVIQLMILILIAVVVFIAGALSKWFGAALGLIAATFLGLHGLARLGQMAVLGGSMGRLAGKSLELMIKIGAWRERDDK